VPVETELGVVREVTAELEKERSELPIHAVEVVVVDHGGRPHQPGVGLPSVRMTPLLRADHARLLLGLPDEQDPFLAVEAGQVLAGDFVLALSFGEGDHRDPLLAREALNLLDEGVADRLQQHRRRDRVAAVAAEETNHSKFMLQFRNVSVEVEPVNALHFQRDVLAQDFGQGAGDTHGRLRSASPRPALASRTPTAWR